MQCAKTNTPITRRLQPVSLTDESKQPAEPAASHLSGSPCCIFPLSSGWELTETFKWRSEFYTMGKDHVNTDCEYLKVFQIFVSFWDLSSSFWTPAHSAVLDFNLFLSLWGLRQARSQSRGPKTELQDAHQSYWTQPLQLCRCKLRIPLMFGAWSFLLRPTQTPSN